SAIVPSHNSERLKSSLARNSASIGARNISSSPMPSAFAVSTTTCTCPGGLRWISSSASFSAMRAIHSLCLHGGKTGHARHQLFVLAEKRDVLVVGRGLDGVDLDRIRAPVLEKDSELFPRQFAGAQLLHERRLGHARAPARGDFAIVLLNELIGVVARCHDSCSIILSPTRDSLRAGARSRKSSRPRPASAAS